MNRRDFLALAGGMAGYSVWVRPEGRAAEAPSREALSAAFAEIVPPVPLQQRLAAEPHLTLVDLRCDVLVAGGGMAGVCAAVAAARHGAKVVLVQDRSRLGGNASSEVKMHIVGANCHGGRPGWREGGLIEEFRLEDAVNNPQRSFELWDLLLYDQLKREPHVTLILDTTLCAAEVADGRIRRVLARCDKTEHIYRIRAEQFIDCTGDSRLAIEAGAETRWGREAKSEFGESLALEQADRRTLGSSILFTARDYGRPVPFTPPPWARKITKEMLRFRSVNAWDYGYWWIEWGGQLNTIRDNERIRFELLAIVLGVWDYIKNSGDHPSSANWGMDWIGMLPGKRENRRIMGEYLLTQHDLEGRNGEPEDAVAIGGWAMDDHPPDGFDRSDQSPLRAIRMKEVYNIPLRALYSRNISNLFMAGRNISATHVAFTSTRVMATCSVMGQAVGTAAAACVRHGLPPRELVRDRRRLRELQQTLLRDDQTIKGLRNEDPADLARRAKATASATHFPSRPEMVLDGFVRDLPGKWTHRWGAPMQDGPVWLELTWDRPPEIRRIQLTFDTGFHRELTLSASAGVSRRIIRAPQPETVRDYVLTCLPADGGPRRELARVTGNYQRLRRHEFAPVRAKSVRLEIRATNGSPLARVYEMRVY